MGDDITTVGEESGRRESRIADLEAELAEKERRIEQLEAELEEARDLSRMAEQFAEAMVEQVDGVADSSGDEPRGTAGDGGSASNGTAIAESSGSDEDAWTDAGFEGSLPTAVTGAARPIVEEVTRDLSDLDAIARGMLAHYRREGPATPLDAHVAGGGDGDRTAAYRRNGQLRDRGFIEHAGRGQYGYALPALVRDAHDDRLDGTELDTVIRAIEQAFVDADAENAHWPGEAPETTD